MKIRVTWDLLGSDVESKPEAYPPSVVDVPVEVEESWAEKPFFVVYEEEVPEWLSNTYGYLVEHWEIVE